MSFGSSSQSGGLAKQVIVQKANCDAAACPLLLTCGVELAGPRLSCKTKLLIGKAGDPRVTAKGIEGCIGYVLCFFLSLSNRRDYNRCHPPTLILGSFHVNW